MRFTYGSFVNVLISFLVVAAVPFFLVVKPVTALMQRIMRPEEPPPEAPTEGMVLLREIRDLLGEQRSGA